MDDTSLIKAKNIVVFTDESRVRLGKQKRSNSLWKDAFGDAMCKFDASPDVPLLQLGPNNDKPLIHLVLKRT